MVGGSILPRRAMIEIKRKILRKLLRILEKKNGLLNSTQPFSSGRRPEIQLSRQPCKIKTIN
jgi:hypothetical protein